ncbi:hypothetical protein PPYR_06932 [Photinus pyralis]|uniref:Thioredoxin domain-containing protein n=1 Tax=Photinus pyralis TaxID=7054 RepID=A0A1Y1L533_PHOPY|nr:hypothetical protein PPYR_06932 [Photinus pyralis]
MLKLGEFFPNFLANTTIGPIQLYDWMEKSWCMLLSYHSDFDAVCTSELASLVKLHDQFRKRNVKLMAISCDSLSSHTRWISDILECSLSKDKYLPFPIVADENCDLLLEELNLLTPNLETTHVTYLIDPTKRIRLSTTYPPNVGRKFREMLKVIDALQDISIVPPA